MLAKKPTFKLHLFTHPFRQQSNIMNNYYPLFMILWLFSCSKKTESSSAIQLNSTDFPCPFIFLTCQVHSCKNTKSQLNTFTFILIFLGKHKHILSILLTKIRNILLFALGKLHVKMKMKSYFSHLRFLITTVRII